MTVEIRPTALPAPPATPGPYRRADYLALPAEPRCQLIYGNLVASPSPQLMHQLVVSWLCATLREIACRTGGLAVVAPMDVTLAEHSAVQPDALYVAPDQRDILGERINGAPALVVEVLSPSTAAHDRGAKLRLYAESGVREYWIVDPAARTFEAYVNRDGAFVVHLPTDTAYTSPVDGALSVDLAGLWTELDSAPST